jgi:hypothetical protein
LESKKKAPLKKIQSTKQLMMQRKMSMCMLAANPVYNTDRPFALPVFSKEVNNETSTTRFAADVPEAHRYRSRCGRPGWLFTPTNICTCNPNR